MSKDVKKHDRRNVNAWANVSHVRFVSFMCRSDRSCRVVEFEQRSCKQPLLINKSSEGTVDDDDDSGRTWLPVPLLLLIMFVASCFKDIAKLLRFVMSTQAWMTGSNKPSSASLEDKVDVIAPLPVEERAPSVLLPLAPPGSWSSLSSSS